MPSKNSDYKRYSKKSGYSYALGAFPTIELIKAMPGRVVRVFAHTDLSQELREKIEGLCRLKDIPFENNDRVAERLRDKENSLAVGVFVKYGCQLGAGASHVVLVNPSDGGNLGTIVRSCVGFGIPDLALIEPAADIFHPKVVRASMGALFHLNFQYFKTFEEYRETFSGGREMYPFLSDGEAALGTVAPQGEPFSLIFGNEARGLDDSYLKVGLSVRIPHTDKIDSLNLSQAAGIGIYSFTRGRFG